MSHCSAGFFLFNRFHCPRSGGAQSFIAVLAEVSFLFFILVLYIPHTNFFFSFIIVLLL